MNLDRQTLNVAISTGMPLGNFARLAPQSALRWGRCAFTLNPADDSECDYWIVFNTAPAHTALICAPENTLFIAGEPPAKKVYPRAFYAQFQRLICTHGEYPHPRVIFDALGLNWHVGYNRLTGAYRYGYDELAALRPTDKQLALSVVCSDLRTTAGQRARLELLERLKRHFGDRLVHFGRGFAPIEDKLDAIAPFHYHLVLENSISDDYWSEKLADAYLGWSYPLYLGCPNLERYFPAASYTRISAEHYAETVRSLEQALSAPPSAAQRAALGEARDRVLNRYNPFARFAHWAERLHVPGAAKTRIQIQSHRVLAPFPRGWWYRLRQGWGSAPRR
ncbi:MAG: glycosyltransferase family 10 domain-containing protein [Gammaproteobacteria bacterium]